MNTTASERYLLQGSQPLPLPDLLDLQIKSFQWFCFEGLEELFRSSFPIVSADRKFELHYSNHKVYLPSKSVYECLEKDLNYEAKISGIFTLHDMNTFEVKEQEVFLGNIPFMTPEGTFVVNGVERIIVSQLVRSPGVNFTIIKEGFKLSRFKTNEIPYGVTFQANRGSWIKFEYDFKKRIYLAKIDNPRRQIKVPITIFLKALGFEVDRERRIITYPKAKLGYYLDKYLPNHNIDYKKAWKDQEMKFDSGLFNTLEIDYTNSQSEAQKEFWRKLHPTDPFSEDTLEQMLPGKYFDPRRFDIADVGRHTINNKLNIDIPKNIHVLTEPDLLESFRLLYYLQNGKNDPKTGKPIRLDDVEHLNLENRRVEHIGELLVNQLRKGMQRIERIIKEKMMQPTANKEAPKTLIHIKPLQGTIKEFFGSSKMSQLMDNANPLTSLTHKRRLSAMGPKGIPREAAKFDFRDVHFSHYGRICPIESPEGQNIGLISSMSTFARINSLGFLETPFYKVEKPGQVVIEPPKTFDITPDTTLAEIKEKLLNNQLTSDLSIDGFTVTDDSLNTILGLTCNEDIRLTDNTVLIEKGTKVTLEDIRLIKEALDKNSQDSEQISIEIDSWTDKAKDNLDFEQISRAFNKPPILLITKETTIVDEDCYGILEQVKRHKATVTAYIKVLFETTLIVHDKLNKDFYLDLIVNYRCVVTDDVREENGETLIPANAELTAEIFQKILSKAKKSKLFIPILAPFRVLQRPSLRRDTLGEFQTLNKYVQWQSADQEVPYNIAPSTIKLNSDWELIEDTVYIRKGDNFERVNCDEVDFVEVSPAQFISVTTSLIPFLEHDDANRALMGSNMQRQAVPLLHTEAPLVGTGLERKVAEDSGAMLVCPSCGKVEYFDSKEIHLRKGVVYHKDTFEILDIPRLQDLQAEEIINEENFNHYYTRPSYLKQHLRDLPQSKRGVRLLKKPDRLELIRLRKYKRSNQGTLINHRIRVSKDQILVKGELVADASSTHHGELALGRNVIVAFMPWRGYNYEDAILVSEKLIHNDAYTSLHIEKHECEARPTKLGPERITNEITGISEDYIRNRLDSRGIILVGAEVKAGDILVGKTTPKGESDLTGEEKLIRAVFGDKGKGHKNTSLKVPHGEDGVVIETQYFSREQGDELPNSIHELVRVYIAKKRTLKVGDKMAGRHGNKGVVSRILPVEDMPFLPDGTPVDIVLNPLGVPSRMNIGQVLETHLGLACAMIPEAHAEDYQELIKDEKPISFDRSKRTHELVIDFDNLELLKSCKVLKDIELNILKKDTVINRNDIIQIQELLHLGSIDVDDLFSRLSECVRYTRDDSTIPDLFVGGTAINDIIKPEIAIKKGTVLQIENLDDIIKPYLEDKTITVDDLEVAFGCKVDVKNLGELLKRRALSDIYRREKILRKGDVVTAQHIESIKSAVEAGLIDVRTAIDSMEVSITPNNIDKMLGGIVKKDIKTIVSKKDSVVREDDIKLFRDKVKEDHTFLDVLKSSISINIDRTYYKPARKPLRIGSPVFESISEDTIRMLYKKLNLPLDGKSVLFDGLSGDPFIERVMVGVMYFMKLNHLVDDKMHARSTGSYALITQQPLGGKAQFGGQRLGEMEVWALEGYGAAYLLKEMLTVKSDDIDGRNKTYKAIVEGNIIPEPGIPESFNVMINELKTLCLDVSVYDENNEIIDLSEFDEEDRSKVVRVYDENIDTDVFLDPSLEDDMPDMVMAPGKRTRRPRTKE